VEALSPIIMLPNPASVPVVSYEYLFYHPMSDRTQPPARRKALGLLLRSCTLGTAGHRLRPNNMYMTGSPIGKMAGRPYTLYQIHPYHSWLERKGHPSKKNKT
jgi:hypothetical protein